MEVDLFTGHVLDISSTATMISTIAFAEVKSGIVRYQTTIAVEIYAPWQEIGFV